MLIFTAPNHLIKTSNQRILILWHCSLLAKVNTLNKIYMMNFCLIFVVFLNIGWHNYHHVFPYDYKTSDHNKYWCNFTTGLLDFMAWIGKLFYFSFVPRHFEDQVCFLSGLLTFKNIDIDQVFG